MISNTDEQFQPRVGDKIDGDSELAKMSTEFIVLFVELRFGHLMKDDNHLDKAETKQYLKSHIIGTMLMSLWDVPEIFKLTDSLEIMLKAKETIMFWLNQATFKDFYGRFEQALSSIKAGDMDQFVDNYEKAMFELREYFVTHSVFASMCIKANNIQSLEDNLKTHFNRELKRTGCDCHNCQAIKQHFKL